MTPTRTPANPLRGFAVWAGAFLAGVATAVAAVVLIIGLGGLLYRLVEALGALIAGGAL